MRVKALECNRQRANDRAMLIGSDSEVQELLDSINLTGTQLREVPGKAEDPELPYGHHHLVHLVLNDRLLLFQTRTWVLI